MTRAKKTQKFAVMKRMISLNDARIRKETRDKLQSKKRVEKQQEKAAKLAKAAGSIKVSHVPQVSSALFFNYNTSLGPPYHILLDTNFVNFSVKNKLDVYQSMADCLYAKCTAYITDCVMAELEKLGRKYRVALKMARDPRFVRLTCLHKGTYADDCLVNQVTQHKCYIVATCDKALKRRIRKIPGVPIMFIQQHRYSIERLPDAFGAPKS